MYRVYNMHEVHGLQEEVLTFGSDALMRELRMRVLV